MRFVEFWNAVTGSDPRWLYFDSRVVDYPELSRLDQRKIYFVTIRDIFNQAFGDQIGSMRDPELDIRVTPRAFGTYPRKSCRRREIRRR